MSIETSEPSARKPRQKPPSVQDARDVREALAPVVAKLGHWQRTLSLVKAKISRGSTDPLQLIGACRAIAQEVASSRRIVRRAIPDRLRNHGRVLDIERSLAVAEFEVNGLLRDLAATDLVRRQARAPQPLAGSTERSYDS